MEPLETLHDAYQLDSDDDCDLRPIDSDDSDDDLTPDLVERLQGFRTQHPHLKRVSKKPVVEDEFERQMDAELSASMAAHCQQMRSTSASLSSAPPNSVNQPAAGSGAQSSPSSSHGPAADRTPASEEKPTPKKEAPEQQQYYDDAYFDSDDDSAPDDEEGERTATDCTGSAATANEAEPGGVAGPAPDPTSKRSQRRRRRRPVLSNDELMYDPSMDDDDQQWVDRQRRSYLPQQSQSGNLSAAPQKLPRSDAVLNCPACMTMLCLDCQRHELYNNQYRAMFVFNCEVDRGQALRYKQKPRRRGAGRHPAPGDHTAEVYHPAKCTTCKTEVAVYDGDEVYHFFNVIASHT